MSRCDVARHERDEGHSEEAAAGSGAEDGCTAGSKAWDLRAAASAADAEHRKHDCNGLEVLSRQQCLQLVAHHHIGRVVFTDHALPVALPVNFALLGDDVVFRTATGAKLSAALAKSVVAFQVDHIDPVSETGWSVLIQGWATHITRPDELALVQTLPLKSWAPGERWHFVRIRCEIVSGRRLAARAPLRTRKAP